MDSYSLLIVDDEEDVVDIILRKTDWESLGFTVKGTAGNGAEALEMMEEFQADVVMTDIKMPYMDGLELSRELKSRWPDTKVIIFSGFDEFEYAKEAIKIEVEEYLLKPIDPDELKEVLLRVKQNLDRERRERQDIDLLRSNYIRSLPMLQENFTIAVIEGRVPADRLGKYLESYQIELGGPLFAAAVLHVSGRLQPDDRDSLLFTVSVRQLVEEQLKEVYRLKMANYLGDLAVIAQLQTEEMLTELTDALDGLCRQAKRLFDLHVTAGIGTVCKDLPDIRKSYQSAKRALAYRAVYGNGKAISISEVDPGAGEDEPWEKDAVKAIIGQMRVGNTRELQSEIDGCVGRFRQSGGGIFRYQVFMMDLVSKLTEFAYANGIDAEELFGGRRTIMAAVFESESPEATGEWIKQVGERIEQILEERRNISTISFVSRAKDYVEQNYSKPDISVEAVCHSLGVSSAYFSTIFKKETGKTFIGFLTDYRMERAVELLMNTADKTYMIAEKTGYQDPNYFSYVFKKQYGLSPSKYRQERRARGDS